MANNYVQFSEVMVIEDQKAKENLLSRLTGKDDDDDYICSAEFEDEQSLWIYADEAADLEALWGQIMEWQVEYKIDQAFTMTWAETCSKPRESEFGGGWAVIYKGKLVTGNTWDAAADTLKALLEGER